MLAIKVPLSVRQSISGDLPFVSPSHFRPITGLDAVSFPAIVVAYRAFVPSLFIPWIVLLLHHE
jgi:hypothetical protein